MKGLVLGLVVLVLTQEREVVGYRDDHYILHGTHSPTQVYHTPSANGHCHTVTHTYWLPTVTSLASSLAFINIARLHANVSCCKDDLCEVAKREMKRKMMVTWARGSEW